MDYSPFTATCSYCKSEIAFDALVCPFCRNQTTMGYIESQIPVEERLKTAKLQAGIMEASLMTGVGAIIFSLLADWMFGMPKEGAIVGAVIGFLCRHLFLELVQLGVYVTAVVVIICFIWLFFSVVP